MNKLLALSLVLGPVVVAGTAHAQPAEPVEPADEAPAETLEAAPPMAPAPPPVVAPAPAPVLVTPAPAAPCVAVRAAAREPLMANRWSVGLSLGSMSLKPDGSTDSTSFGVGELALRYRVTPHLELEVSAGGGREQLDNGMQGDLEVTTFAGAARYRFNPYGAWNWFVMGGVGAAAVTFHDASDQARKDATHPMGMLGLGVERRFEHFALQAELRGIGIAEKDRDREMPAATVVGAPPTTDAADVKQSGGEVTVGASWYF